MKTLKKALSLSLALALSLAMAVPAFAAPRTFGTKDDFAITTFSDVVSEGTMSLGGATPGPLFTVKAGTTFTSEKGKINDYMDDYGLYLTKVFTLDGENYDLDDDVSYAVGEPGDGITWELTDDFIGLWLFGPMFDGPWCYLNIIADDGSATEQPTTPTDPTTSTSPVTPDAPGTYTVKKGDTWSSICTNFYGTNAQRYALMKANKNVKLKEGAVIALPEKLGKDTLIPAPAAGAGEKLYTVKAGDTLGKIAAAEYGKAGEYKAIFERNADRLKNANTIYEGQVIVLPAQK